MSGPWEMYGKSEQQESTVKPDSVGDGPWSMYQQEPQPITEPPQQQTMQQQPPSLEPKQINNTSELIESVGGYKRFFDIVSGAAREITGQAFRSSAGIDITEDVQKPTIEASPDLPNRARLGIFLSNDPNEKARIIAENVPDATFRQDDQGNIISNVCLLYTSDAADDSLRVDLGGRRII